MSLRESNTDKLKQAAVPDALKTGPEQVADTVQGKADALASHLPGQSRARDALDPSAAPASASAGHDAGRAGLGTSVAAAEPAGELGWGEWARVKADQLASQLEPHKSTAQAAKDAATPGARSGPTLVEQIEGAVVGVAEAARGAAAGVLGGGGAGKEGE
ncbi:hypothetical protein Q5752_004427 [Cryptotrichosporon argae]